MNIDDVEVAFADAGAITVGDAEWLWPREQAVLATLPVEKRRNDWRLGRWVAKLAAESYFFQSRIEILASEDGAPELYVNGVPTGSVSISHRAGHGMAVVSRAPAQIGCDVELIEDRSANFVNDYFTNAEIAFVNAATPTQRALLANAIWSAKEAVLKATRTGLRRDTRAVAVTLQCGPGWQPFTAVLDDMTWNGVWRADERWVHTIVLRAL